MERQAPRPCKVEATQRHLDYMSDQRDHGVCDERVCRVVQCDERGSHLMVFDSSFKHSHCSETRQAPVLSPFVSSVACVPTMTIVFVGGAMMRLVVWQATEVSSSANVDGTGRPSYSHHGIFSGPR